MHWANSQANRFCRFIHFFPETRVVPIRRRAAMATACPQAMRAVSTASRRAFVASHVRASARVPRRPRIRTAACVAAAATDDDTLASARALAVPVAEAPDAVPPGPAVFALLDGAGPDANVAYVGVSKRADARRRFGETSSR